MQLQLHLYTRTQYHLSLESNLTIAQGKLRVMFVYLFVRSAQCRRLGRNHSEK